MTRRVICLFCFLLVACQSIAQRPEPLPPASDTGSAGFALSSQTCEKRVNDTVDKLEACILRGSLWHHLAHFQRIASENPGPDGHPNRDTGTTGYIASVGYVAGLMRQAGYTVTVQQYIYNKEDVVGTPTLRIGGQDYAFDRDWFVARGSGAGTLTALVQPPSGTQDGCHGGDWRGFTPGRVALLQRGECDLDTQAANAESAGARAVILYSDAGGAYEARLIDTARVPVIGPVASTTGIKLLQRCRSGDAPVAQIDIRNKHRSGFDYNVIADSPYGDPSHTVVIDAHLDSIYGAGMLDNASGSATILEIALNLAKTPTRNHLRFIWFGGEEIALLGSHFYTTHLSRPDLHKIAFDVDADVTATPNYDILIANPANSSKVKEFPRNVVPESKIGNAYFADYFNKGGTTYRSYRYGNDGTDSLSFSFAGVPNTGILTQQDCCKRTWETKLWGGFRGNYEGKIPSFNGGCVDYPGRWCDNLYNNDPFVFELVSKAVAYVTLELANRRL